MQVEILHAVLLLINLGLSFVSPDEYQPEDKLALELVDWEAYQYVMSEEEYLALQDYLPVLTNESTFIWQEGSLPSSDIYGHEPQQTITIEEFRCNMSSGRADYSASHPLEVLEVAVCDLDDDGTDELILYFHYTDYYFLVLTQEDGVIYGNDNISALFRACRKTAFTTVQAAT